jgi:hypothetical protein
MPPAADPTLANSINPMDSPEPLAPRHDNGGPPSKKARIEKGEIDFYQRK